MLSKSKEIEKNLNVVDDYIIKTYGKNYIIYIKTKKNKDKIRIIIFNKYNHSRYGEYISCDDICKDYFCYFNKDNSKLYKYLVRLFNVNLFTIKKNNEYNLTLSLFLMRNNKDYFLNINLPIILEHIDESNANTFANIITNNTKRKSVAKKNVFIYKYKKKEYQIIINKNSFNDMQYEELLFKIITVQKNNRVEYHSYVNLIDLINICTTYYTMFDDNMDDILDDFLIILFNNNYKLEVNNDKIKFYYYVFNANLVNHKNNPNLFYCLNITLNKFEKERTKDEFDSKVNNYYIKMYKRILQNLNNNEIKNEEKKKRRRSRSQVKFLIEEFSTYTSKVENANDEKIKIISLNDDDENTNSKKNNCSKSKININKNLLRRKTRSHRNINE